MFFQIKVFSKVLAKIATSVFFDFPYIAKEKLQDLWSHGFIKINRIDVDSKENRGRYLSKYFGKDLDLKEHKKKAFFKSQNLKDDIFFL